MKVIDILSVSFSALALIISFVPNRYIYQGISYKPPASKTLVDLIFKDFIILSYSAATTFLLGQIGCLASPDYALSFPSALIITSVLAFLMEAIAVSLFISGGLRLLTLINRSEASGLQLLGPDDLAIWIVRGISISLSLGFTATLIYGLQVLPGPFYVFHHRANMSAVVFEKMAPGTSSYLLPPAAAAAMNVGCKLFHLFLRLQDVRDRLH